MGRKRSLDNVEIDPKSLDVKTWPSIFLDRLSEDEQKKYQFRKQAVEMYIEGRSLKEIEEVTNIKRKEVTRYLKRCLASDENGYIWGYRGLVPQKNLVNYQRNLKIVDGSKPKGAGVFQQLLRNYPAIENGIQDYFFRKKKRQVTDPVIQTKHLHKKFVDLCRAVGIQLSDYPFTTKDIARRSLYRYVEKLAIEYPRLTSKRYGVNLHINPALVLQNKTA